ncbi:MAG TPA: hypothetical protein VNK96_00525 [Fimbriimonadales bacterium]|nr:hypothetical protein [Fimbriimonadales bacterium]
MKRCKYEEKIILLAYGELDEAEKDRSLAHVESCTYCKNVFQDFKRCAEAIKSLPEAPVSFFDSARLREAILSRELRMATRLTLARAFAFSAFFVAVVSLALLLPNYYPRDSSTKFVAANLSNDSKPSSEGIENGAAYTSPNTFAPTEEGIVKPENNQKSMANANGGADIPKKLKTKKKPLLVATSVPKITEKKTSENSAVEEVSEVVLAASLGAGNSSIEAVSSEDNTSASVVIIQPGKTGFPAGAVEVKSPDDVSVGG